MIKTLLLIGLGGFFGAVGRYSLAGVVHRVWSTGFPLGTLVVNVTGCLLIGALMYLFEERELLRPTTRHLVMVGFLGSFTTFSTFGYETLKLLQDQDWLPALANVLANLVVGLAAVALGWIGLRALGV